MSPPSRTPTNTKTWLDQMIDSTSERVAEMRQENEHFTEIDDELSYLACLKARRRELG